MTSESIQQVHAIAHSSDIAAARRAGTQLAGTLGFDETTSGKLAIVITEAATNILKHAATGKILLRAVSRGESRGVEVLALDKGPGIANLAQSLRDGVSSVGTPGNGLGAMRRQSDQFDVYAAPGKGAAFYMCVWTAPPASEPVQIGAVCLPMIGEDECGDAWAANLSSQGAITLLVADGLGHGPEAARAGDASVKTLRARPLLSPSQMVEAAHVSLRSTRGAALAVASAAHAGGDIVFAGVGNISACVWSGGNCKHLMSHNGIVGHTMRKVQEIQQPWPSDALFIMHSDGLSKQWDLASYPGLLLCHPALIAGVLYRDFSRDRDDVTVIVAKRKKPA